MDAVNAWLRADPKTLLNARKKLSRVVFRAKDRPENPRIKDLLKKIEAAIEQRFSRKAPPGRDQMVPEGREDIAPP
jgi:hypothetical protein